MASAERAAAIAVEVVYCPRPGDNDVTALVLDAGSTVADAVRASGVLARHGIAEADARLGVWCRAAAADAPLRDRDRVEIYRPLMVDPKEARRLRYRKSRGAAAA